MKPFLAISLGFLCLTTVHETAGATVRRVPLQYSTIQAAINAAAIGDTVVVDEGTYKENIVITKKITVGSLFVLDGDTSHISRTIIDGSQPHNADSSAVVTIDGATDTTTVVAGFTITGGKGNRRYVNYPGLTYWMILGTGIDIAGGGARIHHNIVRANNLESLSEWVGGVVNIFDASDKNGVSYAIVENNTVADNDLIGKDVEGGAFAIGHNSTIRDNVIARNTIQGESYPGQGAAFQIWNGHVRIERNLIIKNRSSDYGGGLYGTSVPSVSLAPDIEMVNNIVAGNYAGTSGGGLFVSVMGASVNLVNNTFASNSAPSGGTGIVVQNGAIVRALNTILWDTSGSEVLTATGGSFVASYCDVHGGFPGTGNINADPWFTDSTYRLSDSSTCCIEAGALSASLSGTVVFAPSIDFYGSPRPYPAGSMPDIGACEYPVTGVRELDGVIPTSYALGQNYPNPFNPRTTIEYELPARGHVTLTVYNLLGQTIVVLVDEILEAGYKSVDFNASGLPSGVYLYRLTAGDFVAAKKLVVVK
jgi:hypothetical protein